MCIQQYECFLMKAEGVNKYDWKYAKAYQIPPAHNCNTHPKKSKRKVQWKQIWRPEVQLHPLLLVIWNENGTENRSPNPTNKSTCKYWKELQNWAKLISLVVCQQKHPVDVQWMKLGNIQITNFISSIYVSLVNQKPTQQLHTLQVSTEEMSSGGGSSLDP